MIDTLFVLIVAAVLAVMIMAVRRIGRGSRRCTRKPGS
jgi:hypothetical protein